MTMTIEERRSLSKMLMRLFDLWGLADEEQAAVLGYSPKNLEVIRKYRSGEPLADRQELIERAGILLVIHEELRIIFPHNLELAYSWVRMKNKRFDNRMPLEVMLEDIEGLRFIRNYLSGVV